MFQFYQNAFHARKTYEGTPPDSDDIHIMMDIYGVENLIGPGVAPGSGNSICCEIRFTDENEFCRAYGILTQESKSHSPEGPFPWAARSGLVEDKLVSAGLFITTSEFVLFLARPFILRKPAV